MWIVNERPDGTRYRQKPGDMFPDADKYVGLVFSEGDIPEQNGIEFKLHKACGNIGLFEYW